ncbi:MAG: hypothetical protein ABIG60_01080 [Patescibacteria group bacterium]
MSMQLIGLSLSDCLVDIVLRRVNLKDVKKIISRTAFWNAKQLELVLIDYASIRWTWKLNELFDYGRFGDHIMASEKLVHLRIEKAKSLARDFYHRGMIEQPRLSQRQLPDLNGMFHWVSDETQIIWKDDESELTSDWEPEMDIETLSRLTWEEAFYLQRGK